MNNLQRFSEFNTAYQGMLYPMELDHMGHANVRYYSRAFNEAAYYTFTTAGVTPSFIADTGHGMAAVEEHFLYRREIRPGELVMVKTCFIDFTAKALHVWGVMLDAINGEICAVNDQVCVHFDTASRKAINFPPDIFERGRALVRERPVI
jgi:acyl-CoA thioester hydrolase